MNDVEKKRRKEEYLKSKREFRKGVIVTAIFILFSTIVSYFLGYKRSVSEIKFIFGFPDWVFYGVLIPWIAIVLYTIFFAKKMEDW